MSAVDRITRKRAICSRKISSTDSWTQPSPKVTRGRIERWRFVERSSIELEKSATRVSFHRREPKRIGEFTAAASTGPVTSCATL